MSVGGSHAKPPARARTHARTHAGTQAADAPAATCAFRKTHSKTRTKWRPYDTLRSTFDTSTPRIGLAENTRYLGSSSSSSSSTTTTSTASSSDCRGCSRLWVRGDNLSKEREGETDQKARERASERARARERESTTLQEYCSVNRLPRLKPKRVRSHLLQVHRLSLSLALSLTRSLCLSLNIYIYQPLLLLAPPTEVTPPTHRLCISLNIPCSLESGSARKPST